MRKAYYLPTILIFIVFYVILVWQAPTSWSEKEKVSVPKIQQTGDITIESNSFSSVYEDLIDQQKNINQMVDGMEDIYFDQDVNPTSVFKLRQANQALFDSFTRNSGSLKAIIHSNKNNTEQTDHLNDLIISQHHGIKKSTRWNTMLTDLQFIVEQGDAELLSAFKQSSLGPALAECRSLQQDWTRNLSASQKIWPGSSEVEQMENHTPESSSL